MWTKSENSRPVKPAAVEKLDSTWFVRKDFILINGTEEVPEHYEYEEWQMTQEQYDVYLTFAETMRDQEDALVELAELISEVM